MLWARTQRAIKEAAVAFADAAGGREMVQKGDCGVWINQDGRKGVE